MKLIKSPILKIEKILINSFPIYFLKKLSDKCQISFGDRRIFVLSFDCDNSEDVVSFDKIFNFINKYNIKSTLAVPGEILLENRIKFEEIFKEGHRFISHGYLKHSAIIDNKYISTLYYHNLSDGEIEEDIYKGFGIFKNIFGYAPTGFRIPHFGHSNSKKELRRVYKILKKFDYKYSSSTLPYFAIKYGPIYNNYFNIIEIPISPSFTLPLSMLDTYNYGFRNGIIRGADFLLEFQKVINFFSNKPICLNYYCDPSQVLMMPEWFEVIRNAVYNKFEFITMDNLIKLFI